MRKRGILSAVVASTLLLSTFTACNADSGNGDPAGESDNNNATTTTAKQTTAAGNTEKAPEESKTETKKDITLTYTNWNLKTAEENNIERKMLAEFTAQTGINIEIVEVADPYIDSLAALAASSRLSDVFMAPNIPLVLENEWSMNIKEMADADADWAKIPKPLEQSTHFKDGIYAIPAGMFMMGFFVNDDLFDDLNMDRLEINPNYDDLYNAIKTMTNLNEQTVGLLNEESWVNWYSAMKNSTNGWFGFDGARYNLNTPEFKEGVEQMAEIFKNKYSYSGLSAEEQEALGPVGENETWCRGQVAMKWDGTWVIPDMVKQSTFAKRFIGVPGGKTVVTGDYMAINPATSYPEEAYELAKWMTFSPEGMQKRLEFDTTGTEFNSLPLTTDQAVIDAYFSRDVLPGLKEAFESLDSGIVELVKVTPGVVQSRWEAKIGRQIDNEPNANIWWIYQGARTGIINYSDFSEDADRFANEAYTTAVAAIDKLY